MTRPAAEAQERSRSHNPLSQIDTRLLDSLPDAAILTDVQGMIIYWNASATRLFGWTADQMIGVPYTCRYPENIRQWMIGEIAKRAAGVDWEGEYEDYRADGSRIWIYACVSRILNDAGEPIAILGISHDISKRKRTECKLLESQRRLEEAQRIARLASWSWDPRTHKVWWSDAIYELFGLLPGQVEPSFEAFLDLLHPQDRPVAIQRSRDIHAGLDMTAHDMRLIRPDGKLIWIHSRSRATRDASGNIVSIEGTDQDITERKLAEQALRESEERYRNFVEHTLDGLMIHAFDGSILDVNSQACQMLGYTRGELIGQTPFFFDCDLNQDRFSDLMQQLWDGNCVIFESRHRRKDGKLFPVEVRLRPIPFHGRPAALALIRNMSHSREAAWHREDRDRLWNHSPDMLLVADAAGVIKQINPAWRKLLGWELEQLFGQPLLELVHDEEKAVVADYLKQVVQSEPTKTGPASASTVAFRLRARDGGFRSVSWNAIYVANEEMLYGFARDVTEQKRLEEQYRQSHKMEAIGQLAGGVAHDFNNLLTVIRSYSDLLLARCSRMDETAEQLLAIREASDRAAGLTAQLLAFGRKAIIEPKILDLNKSVEAAARLLRRLIGEDICLRTELQNDLWKVTIDPVQLEQTLMNLAVNARDAMPRGGDLLIRTCNYQVLPGQESEVNDCSPGAYVQLTVADNGLGMSAEVKRHLFEPFYTTKGVGKGTGLGLATVYGIVHQAGGVIHCDSQLGQGTAFRIYLPAMESFANTFEEIAPQTVLRGQETVLLVEDEQAVRQLAKMILEMHGYEVIEAACGAEALQAVKSHSGKIDLLLSDVVMPDLSGSDLADQVRLLRSQVRVLYMSGYTDDAIVRRGVASAADAFLQKPFTPASLTQKVREVLDN